MTVSSLGRFLVVSVLLAGVSSCGHKKVSELGLRGKFTPASLLDMACSPGKDVRIVRGNAHMKVSSQDASGSFSAFTEATSPDQLKLEVLKPFGGTYATLVVHGAEFTIDFPGHPEKSRNGSDTWAGIPLRWATDLFLGRIPCPTPLERGRGRVLIDEDEALVAEIPAAGEGGKSGKFVYRFKKNDAEKYWADTLHWESGTTVVDFTFDEPDPQTGSPKQFEAKSTQGEVKLRWRDREMLR